MEAQLVHKHVFKEEVVDDAYLKAPATCTEPAVYYLSCQCGTSSEDSEDEAETFKYGKALDHTAGAVWQKDAENHWHICTVCGEEVDKEAHTPDHEGDATEDYAILCEVCGYEMEAQLVHKHVYDQQATASKFLKKAATCTEPAVYYLSCQCGVSYSNQTFTYGEALGHKTNAVWQQDAENHWHSCTRCYEDVDVEAHIPDHEGAATEEYAILCEVCAYVIDPLVDHEHEYVKEVAEAKYLVSEADCIHAAVYYLSCRCGEIGKETFTYGEALGHTPAEAWETDAENHWHICTVCGEVVDAEAHTPDHEGGATEDYAILCDVCGYVIEEQREHIHVWGEPEFSWNAEYDACTAAFVCAGCGEEETVDCVISTEVIREPTTEDTGLIVHTASCEWNGETFTDTVDEEVAVLDFINLSVSDMVIRAGQTAEMTVSIDNVPTNGLGYLNLAISYDATLLELVEVESTGILGDFTGSQYIDTNPYIVLWDTVQVQNTTGEILKLTFRAKKVETAANLNELVTISCGGCCDLVLNDIECRIGDFDTEFLLPGDVNRDGKVNGKDVILVRRHVALFDDELDLRTADVNGDGKVNGKDSLVLSRYVAMFDEVLQ